MSEHYIITAAAIGVKRKDISKIMGISEAKISRIINGESALSGKEHEYAELFGKCLIRGITFLYSKNKILGAKPIEIMKTAQGLVEVKQFLEKSSQK